MNTTPEWRQRVRALLVELGGRLVLRELRHAAVGRGLVRPETASPDEIDGALLEAVKPDCLRAIARRFVLATKGRPHYEVFWPWLEQPGQHEFLHLFMAFLALAPEDGRKAAALELAAELAGAVFE